MRLMYAKYSIDIELEENKVYVLSIENPEAYSDFLRELWSQTKGTPGEIILSEGEKVFEISKLIDCIFNPFDLDCNEKRIMNRLFAELKEYAVVNMVEENAQINSAMIRYVDKVVAAFPYALDYAMEFDLVNLFKMYGICIKTDGETLLETIVEYLKIMKQIGKVSCFVFVGLKSFLKKKELELLYEFAFYEKIYIIIVESMHTPMLNNEKCWIVDNELCMIEPS